MKHILYLPSFIFLVSCNHTPPAEVNPWSSCEVIQGDTCNRTDSKGRKQGKWYQTETSPSEFKIKDTIFYKDGVLIENK
ncbi:MAG: hypothetical protein H0W61_16520 [Bacteroidetes bacterium]|nr:hypothetical protein [Bacteroidota bacterium]